MIKNIKPYRLIILICLFVFVSSNHAFSFALKNENKTIRVAYPIQYGLTDLDENGNYSGYTYEYLEEVAQYTGWDYEFVQVPGSTDEQLGTLMEMVKTGEVDLMGGILYSEPLGKDYSFVAHSYGNVETVLQTPLNNTNNTKIDSQRQQTMRIAVVSKTGRSIEELKEYCRMNLIEPEFIECDSTESQIRMIEEGKADALLNTSLNYIGNLRTIARFAPKPFYFMTAKNEDRGLALELSDAIAEIEQADPYFTTKLYEKYFAPKIHEIVLTENEQQYIKEVGRLNVGVLTDQPPIQFKEEATGELRGFSVDMLRYISSQTQLQFNLVEASSMDQLYEMASQGLVDLVAGMPYDYSVAREKDLAMTRSYISSQYVLLMREQMSEDSIIGRRLAMSETSTYHGKFIGQVVSFDNVDACVRAVNRGDADYTYVDAYTAQYYVNQPEFNELKMLPQTHTPRMVCFGIVKPGNRSLLSILNKVIMGLPEEELQTIINSNTINRQEFSIGYFVQRNPFLTVVLVAGVFSMIMALLIIILIQRTRSNKQIAIELQKHLRLYAISNDYFFEYDYKQNRMIYSKPCREESEQSEVIKIDFNIKNQDTSREQLESREQFLKILQSGKNCIHEIRLLCIDEKIHWLRIAMEIIRDDIGRPIFAIGKINVIDDEKNEKEDLLEKAQRDSLTHIYNTEASQRMISKSIAELSNDESGALLIMDVDNFKSINDSYGHMRGDEVLILVAELLQQQFGKGSVIGRPGGDEFIVYLQSVKNIAELSEKCGKLRNAVREIVLDETRRVTISIGAVLVHADQGYQERYQKADNLLYAVKAAGRDNFKAGQ